MTENETGTPVAVQAALVPTATGHALGILTLDAPKTLNGLSLPMARELLANLRAWARDPSVVAVVLRGSGEKAFCAGGDLHALYGSMRAHPHAATEGLETNTYARDFFATEYRLDYLIHAYRKPVICWGNGIVMGGGIGLMGGASHRVVTERSRLAMPEGAIGLYPDVGGSFLLGRVPMRGGLFLALTGAPLDAADAIFAGLADVCIPSGLRENVLDALVAARWSATAAANHTVADDVLARFATATTPGPFRRNLDRIADACRHASLATVVAAIAQLDDDGDAWLAKAKSALAKGAPSSLRIAWEMQKRTRLASLADVFRLEYLVSLGCAAHGDFAEGIRALLIDKDQSPSWSPKALDDASPSWASRFFAAPWPEGQHPLADLETTTTAITASSTEPS